MPENAVIEVEPQQLARLEPVEQAGTLALALMSDQEFERRLEALTKGRERIAMIQRSLMDKDVDYGTIPGTPKPTLLKPGAEKLCDFYHYAADFRPERLVGDNIAAPALAYQTRCELHLGSLDGPIVAVGYGSANSWERRYRYRRGERACPACGSLGTLLRSKQGKAEWFCWAKKGGCGKTFRIDDPKVTEQQIGDVENPDPYDLDTTLLKMAEKRAHVDATLRGTAASGLFTQDVEDAPQPVVVDEPAPPPARRTLRDALDEPDPASEPDPRGSEAPEPSEAPTLTAEDFKAWLLASGVPIPKARDIRLALFPDTETDLTDAERAVLKAELEKAHA